MHWECLGAGIVGASPNSARFHVSSLPGVCTLLIRLFILPAYLEGPLGPWGNLFISQFGVFSCLVSSTTVYVHIV